jgi:hypothetical protein
VEYHGIHNTRVRGVVHVVLAVGLGAAVQAQKAELPTVSAVRAMTRDAQAEGKGDSSAIVLALDKRVRARWGDFETFPVSIVRRQDLTIYLATPYMAYRRAVIEHLRMREALSAVPWTDAAVINVSPERIDAPDIIAVTVTRDGREIKPLRSQLRPMQFSNGSGSSASLHAGEVHFPMPAFSPGGAVVVRVLSAAGEPFVVTLQDDQLQQLK